MEIIEVNTNMLKRIEVYDEEINLTKECYGLNVQLRKINGVES